VKNFVFTNGKSSFTDYDLNSFNKIIITDLAPSPIKEGLELIKSKEVFYTDHHPKDTKIPEEILELRTTKNGYIPSSRTAGEITKLKKWLSVVGVISDAGDLYEENKEFLEEFIKKENISLEELKEINIILSNSLTYFYKDLPKFFNLLEEINDIKEIYSLKEYSDIIEEEIQKVVKDFEENKELFGNIVYFYFEPKYKIKIQLSAIISRKYPENILIITTPMEDLISVSARNPSKKNDMAKLLKDTTSGFQNTSAGGHFAASGATFPKKYLEEFKQNLSKLQNN
jgi:single-stranded DNA-specific DHH superfamily exonuclease